MFEKNLKTTKSWINKVKSFQISNPDSEGVKKNT